MFLPTNTIILIYFGQLPVLPGSDAVDVEQRVVHVGASPLRGLPTRRRDVDVVGLDVFADLRTRVRLGWCSADLKYEEIEGMD